MTAERVDGSSPGGHARGLSRAAWDDGFVAGMEHALGAVEHEDVLTGDDDEVLVEIMGMPVGVPLLRTGPDRHLPDPSAPEHVPLNRLRVLLADWHTIRRFLHESGKVVHVPNDHTSYGLEVPRFDGHLS